MSKRFDGPANRHSGGYGGKTGTPLTIVRAVPLSKEERAELQKAVPLFNAHGSSVANVAKKCRLKTLIRVNQQTDAGQPTEIFYDLVQKATGKIITRRAMTEAAATLKNRRIKGSFWRRVGY